MERVELWSHGVEFLYFCGMESIFLRVPMHIKRWGIIRKTGRLMTGLDSLKRKFALSDRGRSVFKGIAG